MIVLFFCRVTKTRLVILEILDHYCKVSGQPVNLNKTKIQFPTGVNNVHKRDIERIL